MNNSYKNVCFSGGAKGADLAWGEAAKAAGHLVHHYVFDKHKFAKSGGGIVLTQEQLNTADPALKLANKTLKRSFPTRTQYTNNLLRRSYWQVRNSGSLYAIINGFDENGNPKGGTAWAIQMFIDMHCQNGKIYYPLFAFNQLDGQWYFWGVNAPEGFGTYQWMVIDPKFNSCPELKTPSGIWAGVGTRELTDAGRQAISDLFVS